MRPLALLAIRRRAAINFAIVPLVLTLAFDAVLIHLNGFYITSARFWVLLGPVQFFLPIGALCALTCGQARRLVYAEETM